MRKFSNRPVYIDFVFLFVFYYYYIKINIFHKKNIMNFYKLFIKNIIIIIIIYIKL